MAYRKQISNIDLSNDKEIVKTDVILILRINKRRIQYQHWSST